MFIKFGDKTKKLTVKSGKNNNSKKEDGIIYLDSDDRKAKILKESIDEDSEANKDWLILKVTLISIYNNNHQ